ncbi:hypothetical protein H8356DRAFT_1346616 [Neocallimastix lanati (nom. inval.)]|nr:hypothetical protein H8356DRAFT_1346616 [Neocallimastix sp. JGI-2020a]
MTSCGPQTVLGCTSWPFGTKVHFGSENINNLANSYTLIIFDTQVEDYSFQLLWDGKDATYSHVNCFYMESLCLWGFAKIDAVPGDKSLQYIVLNCNFSYLYAFAKLRTGEALREKAYW